MTINDRSNLLKTTMISHTIKNIVSLEPSIMKNINSQNPLFSESEFIERLLCVYKLKHVVDLINTNTFIQDNMISYLIITNRYYILVIRKNKSTRIVIRDKFKIYMDSVIRDDWRMVITNNNNEIHFNILRTSNSTFLFYIKNRFLYFNKTLLNYIDDGVLRFIAVKS